MHHVDLGLYPRALVLCPSLPLLYNLDLPISSPLPPLSTLGSSTRSNSQPKYLVVLVGNCHVQTPSRCEAAQACAWA